MKVLLHNLHTSEEWRCAWEAVKDYKQEHMEDKRHGKPNAIKYEFSAPSDPRIHIDVWKNSGRIHAKRIGTTVI